CGNVPLVPVSTGTNNVFPTMVEGTLAGLAAGLVATGVAGNQPGQHRVIRRAPRLEIQIDGSPVDVALIDVVSSRQAWIGARAMWEPSHLKEIVLSRISASVIGIASIGGALFPRSCDSCSGAWIAVDDGGPGSRSVTVPIAPGLLRSVPIAEAKLLGQGDSVFLSAGPCTLAFDGEREIEVRNPDIEISVRLDPEGPRVVDVAAALAAGAAAGAFVTEIDSRARRAEA
ncbi:MAG TPA: hypothetical protein VK356_03135, partial [Thermomicrobiales bacterium]|nr:hypothetical protein [Thermomicrobiales bacterium]